MFDGRCSAILSPMPSYKTADELPHPKSMLTVNEAASRIGLSPVSVRELIRKGRIGAFKRHWRYGVYERNAYFIPVKELKRYLTKKAVEGVTGLRIQWLPPKE